MQTTQNKKLITSPSGMATTEGRKQNKTKQIQRLKSATQRQAIRTDSETRLENPAVVRIFFFFFFFSALHSVGQQLILGCCVFTFFVFLPLLILPPL